MFLPAVNVSGSRINWGQFLMPVNRSRWYKRAESQKRYSFFFSSTTLAGAFGGLLASAIGKMDGMRGYRGWRWVFILGRDSPAVEAARTLINSPHYQRASSPALSHYCWSFSSQTSRRKPLGFPPRNAPS